MSYSSLRKACKHCYKEAWHPMPHGERPSYWYCPPPDAPLSHGSVSFVCPRTHGRNRSCFSLPHPRVPEPTAGTQFLSPPLRMSQNHCRNAAALPLPPYPRTTAGTAAPPPLFISAFFWSLLRCQLFSVTLLGRSEQTPFASRLYTNNR